MAIIAFKLIDIANKLNKKDIDSTDIETLSNYRDKTAVDSIIYYIAKLMESV